MRSGKQSSRPKRIAQRTCLACREVRPKRELVRIVRTPEGRVALDETGKQSGRGAYICRKRSCWEGGVNRERLARSLRIQTTSRDVDRLWECAENLGLTGEVMPS